MFYAFPIYKMSKILVASTMFSYVKIGLNNRKWCAGCLDFSHVIWKGDNPIIIIYLLLLLPKLTIAQSAYLVILYSPVEIHVINISLCGQLARSLSKVQAKKESFFLRTDSERPET
jgi:hypothetical protein